MSSPTNLLSEIVLEELRKIELTRKRVEALHSNGQLFKRDIEFIYEGMFLKATTVFESFLENLFIGILYGKYKPMSRKKLNKYDFHSRKMVEDILLRNKNYENWMPYEKIRDKANVFYKDGKPFSIMDSSEKGTLKKIMFIRNAIAHKSKYSDKQFRKQIVSVEALPNKIKNPSSYLRYVFRHMPAQTKFEVYMNQLSLIANKIANYNG